jgi:hypothetical protein
MLVAKNSKAQYVTTAFCWTQEMSKATWTITKDLKCIWTQTGYYLFGKSEFHAYYQTRETSVDQRYVAQYCRHVFFMVELINVRQCKKILKTSWKSENRTSPINLLTYSKHANMYPSLLLNKSLFIYVFTSLLLNKSLFIYVFIFLYFFVKTVKVAIKSQSMNPANQDSIRRYTIFLIAKWACTALKLLIIYINDTLNKITFKVFGWQLIKIRS